jgi:tetratricopeptide (TPR) repeat protein
MSWFRKTIFVRRINQKLAREHFLRVIAILFFVGARAIFAQSDLPDSSFTDFDALSANANTSSNSPAASVSDASTAPTVSTSSTSATTNENDSVPPDLMAPVDPYMQKLQTARYLRKTRQTKDVEKILVSLLANNVPENIQRSALLELAAEAQDQDELPRAQQICAQFLNRWPDDPHVPEVLLRQGQLFRQMGLSELALTKFYAVMTTALTVKNDRLDYYEHLVVEAQIEIAETHYEVGKFADAAECFSRLYKLDNQEIDKPQILYKLVRCYNGITNYNEAVASAEEFLAHYKNTPEQAEVRFYLATAYKQLGRDNESLQQVLTLLQEQSARAPGHEDDWAYWRERTGNLIANQFYGEGDYTRALDIYTSLAQLDSSPQWQLPVLYQIGMTYEHLMQPQKAIEIYNQIVDRQTELTTNMPPNLASIADMARWRVGFIQWQTNAQNINQTLADTNAVLAADAKKNAPSHE